nr:uncharacterized protein LOC116651015 [Drosophila virilis]
MPQKWFHFCMIFACITNMSFAQKQILFTKVQCVLMSSQFIKVDCVQESNNSITIHLTTNNKDIANLWIVSDLNLYIFGVKNVMRLHGLRTEYCKAPTPGSRPNLQTMLYQGIKNAQKCPLRRVSLDYRGCPLDCDSLDSLCSIKSITEQQLFVRAD